MKCEEVESKMVDYLDNKLDQESRLAIEKHLETCEICLEDYKEGKQVLAMMNKDEMVLPDDSLRINFYHMLHKEISKNEPARSVTASKLQTHWYSITGYRIAAGLALLICGTFIGLFFRSGINNSAASNELKQLHSEITDLKRTTMYSMLNDQSSSDRIQAVSYATELGSSDENVIEVLVKTLNNDKNVNVRLSAAYALSKFAYQRSVCDSLVKSLSKQTEPILQVTLINILAERKDKSALRPIQEIIANKKTMKEVRDVAENSLRVLI